MPNPRSEAGRAAEDRALAYLEAHGLRLISRNYRCAAGELDLIMAERATLVIVEVRSRRHARFGAPAETVDARKQAKLVRAAQYYLQQQRHRAPVRFDVVAITGAELEWIKNAFETQ